jgi:hypothetical protein
MGVFFMVITALLSACAPTPTALPTASITPPPEVPTMNAMTVTAHVQEILELTTSPTPGSSLTVEGTVLPGLMVTADAPPGLGTPAVLPSPQSGSTNPVVQITLTAPQTFQPGVVITLGGLQMVVTGWSELAGYFIQTPQAGMRFVSVELVILNAGQNTEMISSLNQMYIQDQGGVIYGSDPLANSLLDAPMEGELQPGERLVGSAGFQVPQTIQNLTFVFNLSFPSPASALIPLGASAFQLSVPPGLAYVLPAAPHVLGETFRIGNYNLSVHGVTFPSGSANYAPQPGHRFVMVELSLQNAASVSLTVASLLQMNLLDGEGRNFDVDLLGPSSMAVTSVDGELAAGSTIRGYVVFQAVNASSRFYLVFNPELFGSGPLEEIVALQ